MGGPYKKGGVLRKSRKRAACFSPFSQRKNVERTRLPFAVIEKHSFLYEIYRFLIFYSESDTSWHLSWDLLKA